jgi:ribosomal protein S18 acetylase RimI-like enzyme
MLDDPPRPWLEKAENRGKHVMDAPLFRFAGPSDAAGVTALIERAYRGPETAGRWDSESHLLTGPRTSVSEISSLIDRPDSRFVLTEEAGNLIGCALIQRTMVVQPGAPAGSKVGCYFGMFAIDPVARSAGLGKRVLAEAERRAQALYGAKAMVMTVINLRAGLIAWYERRGYRLTGARLPFPFTSTSGETTRNFDLVELRKEFT